MSDDPEVASDQDVSDGDGSDNESSEKVKKKAAGCLSTLWVDYQYAAKGSDSDRWKKMTDMLRSTYGWQAFFHFCMTIATSILAGVKSNLGTLMILGTTLDKIIPITNTNSQFAGALNQQEVATGSLPPAIFVPIYHFIPFLYYTYFYWSKAGGKWLREMVRKRYNWVKYWVHAISFSLMFVIFFAFIGLRNILGFLFIIIAVFSIAMFCALLEASVASANLRWCEGDTCYIGSGKNDPESTPLMPEATTTTTETTKDKMTKKKRKQPCKKHAIVDTINLQQKKTAMMAVAGTSIAFVVIIWTQVGLSFTQLPSWIQGLVLAISLWIAISIIAFLWSYKRMCWDYNKKLVAFFRAEQTMAWMTSITLVVFSSTLYAEMTTLYPN